MQKSLWVALLVSIVISDACTCSRQKETIKIDGSSTVYVISEAVAEEYQKTNGAKVSIGVSGTGGGFKKLCSNRIDIIGASRVITASEKELCRANNVEYLELPVAFDGIVVVVNKANDWMNEISVSLLKRMFEPAAENKIVKWRDVNPSWPDRKFEIFAPGISSGTYDYFTQVIVGKQHSSRGDITSSEDDNVLVHGVRSTVDGIGFFGFAYFIENKMELKALAIINDVEGKNNPAILPDKDTIRSGRYSPLSRPIYIYANKNLNEKAKEFIQFYLEHSQKVADDVGFISLDEDLHKKALHSLKGFER